MAPSWMRSLEGSNAAWLARRLVEDVTLHRYGGRIPEDATLLTSELVANALRHGVPAAPDASIRVIVTAEGSLLKVSVFDQGPGFEADRSPTAHQEGSGWGLELVERLSDRWGVRREANSTEVWFEMDVNEGSP